MQKIAEFLKNTRNVVTLQRSILKTYGLDEDRIDILVTDHCGWNIGRISLSYEDFKNATSEEFHALLVGICEKFKE